MGQISIKEIIEGFSHFAKRYPVMNIEFDVQADNSGRVTILKKISRINGGEEFTTSVALKSLVFDDIGVPSIAMALIRGVK